MTRTKVRTTVAHHPMDRAAHQALPLAQPVPALTWTPPWRFAQSKRRPPKMPEGRTVRWKAVRCVCLHGQPAWTSATMTNSFRIAWSCCWKIFWSRMQMAAMLVALDTNTRIA